MFRPETVSFRGHFTMANKPDYDFFKFFDIPKEPRRPKEIKMTSLEFAGEKDDTSMGLTGSKYLLTMEGLIHNQSHPEGLHESEGETERRKIYFKKNMVDAFMPEMVAFFQYSNSNFVKDVHEGSQVIRRDDCLIETFAEDYESRTSILHNDLEKNTELSGKETLDANSSNQNESRISEDEIYENEMIEQYVYEAETKEISDGLHHSDAGIVDEIRPVKDLESTVDDKRESISEADQQESPETEGDAQAEDRMEELSQSHVDPLKLGPGESRTVVSKTCSCQTEGRELVQHFCSCSFRSNISHDSSNSFAFPIFPSELTGSPVRIPGSERRKLRLRWRRRVRIFCCKF